MSDRIRMFARGRRTVAAALFAAALLPAAALAQDDAAAPTPAPKPTAPAAAAPAQPAAAAWLKVCGPDQATKKETCVVSQEIRAESGQPIASVSLQPSSDPKKWGLGIVVPLGFVLPPGIGINIDGEKKSAAQYVICIPGAQKQPAACIAQAQVTDEFIAALKKGKEMEMMITTPQGKTVPVEVTLAGFAKTFDGPGLDRAAAENVREQLAKGLQEKADEARKKLIDQQKKELGTE